MRCASRSWARHPTIRPGQMNTSIFVELGNGDNFIFDIGEGSVSNYTAARVALNQMNNIFITHLHVDHYGSLPYVWMFGTWSGGWHKPITVHGPSGRTPEFGTKAMVEGMRQMTSLAPGRLQRVPGWQGLGHPGQ